MIRKIFRSELGKGMIILFVMMNFYNFLNFLFHFIMGRVLGPEGYGTFAVLMSLIYIYGIPIEAIQNLTSRYTTKLSSEQKFGKLKGLMTKSLQKSFLFSFIIFIALFPLSLLVSKFLNIDFWLIILTNVFIFFAFIGPITRGILQGRKKFVQFGSSLIIESGIKIILSISLVFLGMHVFGAMMGVLIGTIFGIFISVYFNRDLLKLEEIETKFNELYYQGVPYFISTIVILLVFSLDIILAKRFFSPELAGQYAVLSMIGKMLFFGTTSIGKAMFPLTSEKHDSGEDSMRLFKKSFIIIFTICAIAVTAFATIPKLVILILYGNQYLKMSPYLVYSGIAFSFLALSNLLAVYALSINKMKSSYFLFIFLAIEVGLLYSFHDNILEYIVAFMASNIVMFIGSLFLIGLWKRH
jgi:O-antigen/teichoic acid export membrane protein